MKIIKKLNPVKDAEKIEKIEKRLIENANGKNTHCKRLAVDWGITVYKGLIYERTIGGEIHLVAGN